VRALAKLEQILPERLRRRVSALSHATSAFPAEGPRIDPDVLAGLAGACRDGMRVNFGYLTGDARAARRNVDPAAMVYSGYRWYLVAFDLDRDDWRTFRLDRITSRVRLEGRGARRPVPGGDPAAYVQRQLRARNGAAAGEGGEAEIPAEPGRIRFQAPAAEIRARMPTRSVRIEADGESACIATTVGPWSRWFLAGAALLDVELELLGPPELIAAAAVVAARLAPA
jgi:predicted DNA-binding transcriptional regulator YafY